MAKVYKMWTKAELKEFVYLWETETAEAIAERFGVSRATISNIAVKFRKAGFPLTMKRQVGTSHSLIREVIAELGKRGR